MKSNAQRRKADVLVIGDGCTAMLSAVRLLAAGESVALVCPSGSLGALDLLPVDGLSLWKAAFRSSAQQVTLNGLWDEMQRRLLEAMPVSVDVAGLKRLDQWSILSSVPIHTQNTSRLEQEFFQLERKSWAEGVSRLVNPDLVDAKFKNLGLKLASVAAIEGAFVRSYAISWDELAIARALIGFLRSKAQEGSLELFEGYKIESRLGRRLMLSGPTGEVAFEYDRSCLVFLTGELLPWIRPILKTESDQPWVKSLRKRRREQHRVLFSTGPRGKESSHFWYELGEINCLIENGMGQACWVTGTGPDGLDVVVDEVLRMSSGRFLKNTRHFVMEWEWKTPQWRQGEYGLQWGTAFESDLWSAMELVWRAPT